MDHFRGDPTLIQNKKKKNDKPIHSNLNQSPNKSCQLTQNPRISPKQEPTLGNNQNIPTHQNPKEQNHKQTANTKLQQIEELKELNKPFFSLTQQ